MGEEHGVPNLGDAEKPSTWSNRLLDALTTESSFKITLLKTGLRFELERFCHASAPHSVNETLPSGDVIPTMPQPLRPSSRVRRRRVWAPPQTGRDAACVGETEESTAKGSLPQDSRHVQLDGFPCSEENGQDNLLLLHGDCRSLRRSTTQRVFYIYS